MFYRIINPFAVLVVAILYPRHPGLGSFALSEAVAVAVADAAGCCWLGSPWIASHFAVAFTVAATFLSTRYNVSLLS